MTHFQGRAADLKYIESCSRTIARVAQNSKIVVEKSTVPVKSSESIINILKANQKPGVKYQVILGESFFLIRRKQLTYFVVRTKRVTLLLFNSSLEYTRKKVVK